MKMLAVWSLSVAMFAGQTAAEPALTEDGMRAWLISGGVIDTNTRQIHEQFAQQRAKLPPWWPKDVADEEEAAISAIDLAKVALPHYSVCMNDHEAWTLAKFEKTSTGQRAVAGDATVGTTAKTVSKKDVKDATSGLSPAETLYASKHFTPARVAAFKTCSAKAFADTSAEMGKLQLDAINAVVEKDRPALVEAKTAYVKDHPDYKD